MPVTVLNTLTKEKKYSSYLILSQHKIIFKMSPRWKSSGKIDILSHVLGHGSKGRNQDLKYLHLKICYPLKLVRMIKYIILIKTYVFANNFEEFVSICQILFVVIIAPCFLLRHPVYFTLYKFKNSNHVWIFYNDVEFVQE